MGGQQRREIVLGGHRGQTREHVLEVSVRVEAATLGGDDERVDDRGAIAGVGVADKEPVLRPEFAGADGKRRPGCLLGGGS